MASLTVRVTSAVSVDIAGPGFINLKLSDAALAARGNEIAGDERLGAERVAEVRRVMVDYGETNVAKPMHVGHLRSSIIGEAIKRIHMSDSVSSLFA